jgi:hypothetical protein
VKTRTKQFKPVEPTPSAKAIAGRLRDFDWAVQQYQTTDRALTDIADDIGVSRTELFDYFSLNNISRSLAQTTQDRAMTMLAQDVVDAATGKVADTRQAIIEVNATMQAALIREHRDDIRRFRKLAMKLLVELEGMTDYADLFEDLGTLLRREDDKGVDKLNDAYKRVISLPGRSEVLERLGKTLKIVVTLERQAFGMRDDYEDEEIRRARIAATPQIKEVSNDFDAITRRFQTILIGVSPNAGST